MSTFAVIALWLLAEWQSRAPSPAESLAQWAKTWRLIGSVPRRQRMNGRFEVS